MPKRIFLSIALLAVLVGPATAQNVQRGGVRTETMERMSQGANNDLIWNLVGLLGLLGLLGFRQEHPDDSYHPSSLE
ncbi:MAG: WGxxGxxG family protein [Sphingomicrobium sp.]